jgi:DNA-binding LacI/PurR family transcriptional regulator
MKTIHQRSGVAEPIRNEAPRAKALRVLRQWVYDGELAAGEAIPSERELAKRLDVALATVQRALRVLESEGVITKHEGRTRTVRANAANQSGLLSDTVLLLAESAELKPLLDSQPYGWAGYVARGAFSELSDGAAHTMVLGSRALTPAALERLLHGKPLGVIIPDMTDMMLDVAASARLAADEGVRCVIYGDEPGYEFFDRVAPDHETGSYELARWLMQRGRRKIVTFWQRPLNSSWAHSRYAGYARAMREAGLEPRPPVIAPMPIMDDLNDDQARAIRTQSVAGSLVSSFIPTPQIDAIMVVSDGEVAAVQGALTMLGKAPNREVEVVGYDNYWEQSSSRNWQTAGPTATVDKDNVNTGRELVRLLFQRINNELPPEPQLRLIRPKLRVLD